MNTKVVQNGKRRSTHFIALFLYEVAYNLIMEDGSPRLVDVFSFKMGICLICSIEGYLPSVRLSIILGAGLHGALHGSPRLVDVFSFKVGICLICSIEGYLPSVRLSITLGAGLHGALHGDPEAGQMSSERGNICVSISQEVSWTILAGRQILRSQSCWGEIHMYVGDSYAISMGKLVD
ncbi:hypothetical protein ACLB2K_055040 [Fragaria x ananassa]